MHGGAKCINVGPGAEVCVISLLVRHVTGGPHGGRTEVNKSWHDITAIGGEAQQNIGRFNVKVVYNLTGRT